MKKGSVHVIPLVWGSETTLPFFQYLASLREALPEVSGRESVSLIAT